MLCAISSKTSMGYFYRKPLVYIPCQVIFATTSQNFMVFQIRGHRFSIFGSSISAIFFRVNHPKHLHLKRNSFKTTIISPSMPYQSTTFQNKHGMGKFFKNIHGLFLSQATRQF
jgi:hypothetical protein